MPFDLEKKKCLFPRIIVRVLRIAEIDITNEPNHLIEYRNNRVRIRRIWFSIEYSHETLVCDDSNGYVDDNIDQYQQNIHLLT